MQADTILKTTGDEIWYSEEYIKKQIELAFQAGMSVGAKIEIHIMQPCSDKDVNDYTNEFWRRVNVEYNKNFNAGHVWSAAGKRSINNN